MHDLSPTEWIILVGVTAPLVAAVILGVALGLWKRWYGRHKTPP